MIISSQRSPIHLPEALDERGCGLKVTQSPRNRSDPRGPNRRQRRNRADFDKEESCLLEQQSAAHYRAVAARARRLHTEATTPRLKQFLEEMIARCEQMVEEVGVGI